MIPNQYEISPDLLTAWQKSIVEHPVFKRVNSLEALRVFMRFHVYAVWDFMSLLKELQRNLTCVSVPWFPVGDANNRYLINEIVAGEESDIDIQGKRKSHFELYLEAMAQSGADLEEINLFIATLQQSNNLEETFMAAGTPEAARVFVRNTFRLIKDSAIWSKAAVFTYGREDLIPKMFMSLVNDIFQIQPEDISLFKYYLERHIEVDGDHHSVLAAEMTSSLCRADIHRWKEATDEVEHALQQRVHLWDGIVAELDLLKS